MYLNFSLAQYILLSPDNWLQNTRLKLPNISIIHAYSLFYTTPRHNSFGNQNTNPQEHKARAKVCESQMRDQAMIS